MQNLWMFIGLFLIGAALCVWLPFFFFQQVKLTSTSRSEENKQAYWDRKTELEEEFAQQKISESIYQARMDELSISTLQELKEGQENQITPSGTLSWWWPVAITSLVLLISVSTYSTVGYTPKPEDVVREQQQDAQRALLAKDIEEVENKVQANPDSSQDWFSLGYLYIESGEYQKAINAFEKVQSLIGEHAEILGGKAQALYYLDNEQLTDRVQAIIDRSLALNSIDPATNILLGMHNYREGQFAQSTKHWQRVMRSSRDDINKAALLQSIRASQQQAGISATDYQVTISVSLSSELQEMANSSDTVFIYAHAPEQRMPLAIHRTTVAELPLTITLDDKAAMSPIASLSSVDEVIVKAVISKSGQAGLKSGDFFVQSSVVDTLGAAPFALKIDQKFDDISVVSRAGVRVELRIAAHILAQVSDDDTVFVFAAPSDGAKVPLVAEKLKVSDLPTTILLQNEQSQDDLMAKAKIVDLHALITKPSQQGFSMGTPKGVKKQVTVQRDPTAQNATGVIITIDSVVGEE